MTYALIPLLPLLAAVITGIKNPLVGRRGAHTLTIAAVGASAVCSILILCKLWRYPDLVINETWYSVGTFGTLHLQIGCLIDTLTAFMMTIVSFVSLMVHIYTIGYMEEDPGYRRFFSYISLFTFAMLMLVMSNNFLQLFFGWEGVGLVSYLLIGFWFQRESAIFANLKAFLVNRVGDFGFLLGIALVFTLFGSLDYDVVLNHMWFLSEHQPMLELLGHSVSAIDLMACLLFVGAMGKSAQVPLHVWLPDSMEGPTPISALIHAATMVTAGIFMVARLSPIFEYSEIARTLILYIGTVTCVAMGILGVFQNDIKRIIAYSTLSQLGLMVAGLGASAYAISIFHLGTHAFFKALLFLGAGSVIVALHHEQNIEKMGGLKKYLPVTYVTMLLGTLALVGFPGFSGFYSKDLLIEAVSLSTVPGHTLIAKLLVGSVFLTALYSFRLLIRVFHTTPRFDAHVAAHLHEPSLTIRVPLVILAVPSVIIGAFWIEPMLFGFLDKAITVLPEHHAISELQHEFKGTWHMTAVGFAQMPFILLCAGFGCAVLFCSQKPQWGAKLAKWFPPLAWIFKHKYGFDAFNQCVLARGTRLLGQFLSYFGDKAVIDGLMVNGSAQSVGKMSQLLRHLQSGYLYHYVFTMFVGMLLLFWWLLK